MIKPSAASMCTLMPCQSPCLLTYGEQISPAGEGWPSTIAIKPDRLVVVLLNSTHLCDFLGKGIQVDKPPDGTYFFNKLGMLTTLAEKV